MTALNRAVTGGAAASAGGAVTLYDDLGAGTYLDPNSIVTARTGNLLTLGAAGTQRNTPAAMAHYRFTLSKNCGVGDVFEPMLKVLAALPTDAVVGAFLIAGTSALDDANDYGIGVELYESSGSLYVRHMRAFASGWNVGTGVSLGGTTARLARARGTETTSTSQMDITASAYTAAALLLDTTSEQVMTLGSKALRTVDQLVLAVGWEGTGGSNGQQVELTGRALLSESTEWA